MREIAENALFQPPRSVSSPVPSVPPSETTLPPQTPSPSAT